MAIDPERVKALFQAAIERGDPADRQLFLAAEIGNDAELRDRLDALLAAYDQPPGALDRPLAADPEATDALAAHRSVSSPPSPGLSDDGPTVSQSKDGGPSLIDTIIADRFKIRQEIGEGGMGTVYLAEQLRPVRRMVALKLIKPGMDSRNVLPRFESERQALALMEHPNITRVVDAGTTADARPFFVMELVKGIPITEYCDAHRLDIPTRLAIFRQVCSAVQHAHQKGIIHRDLKPSNILVEAHDDKPVPKVIDFGLAKATSGLRLTERSLFTAFGSVAGTPLYMAPEQASFNALDVDTRADIYALGVILFELLTGSTPITRDSVQRAALDELLRVIREVEPPTPSSRLSTSEALPSLAANRHVEPARLSRLVRGDLDWIVMKALAKERERRYASAVGLADDLDRHLNHEAVSAGPPTAGYRLRKFVRRNRTQVGAAALVLVALVLGVVGTTLGLFEARRQQRLADQQRRQAEKRLAQVTKMNDILSSIFKDLDPRNAQNDGKPLSAVLGERLDRATTEIEGEATGDRLAVARMQMTLGASQVGLGYPDRAIALFTKARATFAAVLGPDHAVTLASMHDLATSYHAAGQIDRALKLSEETLALRKAKLGPDHPDTLMTLTNVANSYHQSGQIDRALRLREETLALQKAKLGPDHPDTLKTLTNVANSYHQVGQTDRALNLREETLALQKAKLGPDHPSTLLTMSNLANSYHQVGQTDRALKLREETLALQKAKLGPDHPSTLLTMSNLANSYAATRQTDPALNLGEEALALQKAKLGPDHPKTFAAMTNLANSYHQAGQIDRALKLREETLALQKAKLGPDHPDTLKTMTNLANSFHQAGQIDRALKLREETLALQKAKLGPDNPATLLSMTNLASSYHQSGQIDRALRLREETLALQKAKLGPDNPATLLSMTNLASSYHQSGQIDRALRLREETLALQKAKLGPDHPSTLLTMSNLANSYHQVGQTDRALKLYAETVALKRLKLYADHPQTLGSLEHQARCLADSGQLERACAIVDDVIASRRKAQGDFHPHTFWSRLVRAEFDLAGGRLDAARAADQAIFDECRIRLGSDDRVTIAAGLALARVAEAQGDREKALPLCQSVLESARKSPTDRDTLALALTESGRSRLGAGDAPEAEVLFREALALREAEIPLHWMTAEARSLLGGALLGRKLTAEAAPLLRSGYEAMARSAAAIPLVDRPRLAEALDRLIAAGEAAGTNAEVAAWKAERAKYKIKP